MGLRRRVAGDVRGGKREVVGGGGGRGLLALSLGRRSGVAAGSWSCWNGAFRLVEIVSTLPRIRNVASNGNDDHVDRRE